MREQMEERLRMLQAEFKAGQELMTELQAKQTNVVNTLVRISGAIQVLEDLLQPEQAEQPIQNFEFSESQPVAASA